MKPWETWNEHLYIMSFNYKAFICCFFEQILPTVLRMTPSLQKHRKSRTFFDFWWVRPCDWRQWWRLYSIWMCSVCEKIMIPPLILSRTYSYLAWLTFYRDIIVDLGRQRLNYTLCIINVAILQIRNYSLFLFYGRKRAAGMFSWYLSKYLVYFIYLYIKKTKKQLTLNISCENCKQMSDKVHPK